MKCGVVNFQDVTLRKLATNAPFSIAEASSGEQAVVISILGIASQIEDNCIVCIDEPEICLHPEWQERYIKLLHSIFSMYSGCQFIIATHSPQIVSNLEPENSFPKSSEAFKIVHPHFDNYDEHIEIFGRQYYVDKSIKGCITIQYCKLNRRLHKLGWKKEYVEDAQISGIMNQWLEEKDSTKRHQLLIELQKLLAMAS